MFNHFSGKRSVSLIFRIFGPSFLAAILLIPFLWLQESSNARRHLAEQEFALQFERANQTIEELCKSDESIIACKNEVIDTSRDYERSEYDLAAQEDMAQYAFVVVILTLIGVVVTSVATFFVYRTLQATLDAVREAGRASDAAYQAVVVTEEIGNRQLRPFIVYESAKIAVLGKEGGPGGRLEVVASGAGPSRLLEIDVSFRNCGASPGVVTAASEAIYTSDRGRWSRLQAGKRPVRVVIGPNQVERIRFQGPSASDDGKFSTFTIGILIWYDDLSNRDYPREAFEEHFWLYFENGGLRQDLFNLGFSLYRPEEETA